MYVISLTKLSRYKISRKSQKRYSDCYIQGGRQADRHGNVHMSISAHFLCERFKITSNATESFRCLVTDWMAGVRLLTRGRNTIYDHLHKELVIS